MGLGLAKLLGDEGLLGEASAASFDGSQSIRPDIDPNRP